MKSGIKGKLEIGMIATISCPLATNHYFF